MWKNQVRQKQECIYVCEYLDGIHDIQDKTLCIALTPFKHENGRVNNKRSFEPFVNQILGSLEVAWQQTEQRHATTQIPFLGASASRWETQATERLYKDAPPGIPMIILYPISNH